MSVGREGQGSWFFWIAFATLVLAVLGVIGAEIYSIEYRHEHRYDNLTLAELSAKAHLRFLR